MGLPWAVLYKIFGEFQSLFFLYIVEVLSTYFSANTSISKGELLRVFCKSDSLSFSPQIPS